MKKALVLSLIFAVGLGFAGFAQTLSGSWDTDIVLDLATGSATWTDDITIKSELIIEYMVGDWTFSSETDLLNGAWSNQDFDFVGVLGAFTISGAVEFDPDDLANNLFDFLNIDVDVSIAGVALGADFTLYGEGYGGPNVYLVLSGDGVAGDVTIDVDVAFGEYYAYDDGDGCDFDFEWIRVGVDFPFCCATVESTIRFTCDGFDYVEFCVSDITIANLPWLTLGTCITFQTMSKTVSFFPEIDLGVIGCDFDLFYRLETEPDIDPDGSDFYWGESPLNGSWLLDGIWFDGIQIACEIGGVAFTGISYWGPGVYGYGYAGYDEYYPGILYGYEGLVGLDGITRPGPFFEAYQVATTDDGCCGPFSFDVTVFFDAEGSMLFDVAWVSATMEIQIATQFTFGLGLETDVDGGTVNDITFSFLVEW
jgi:hypothetical protein